VSKLTARRDEEFRLAQLGESQKAGWIETFKHFDKHNSNTLEAHEFKAVLSSMSIDFTDESFQELWKSIDLDSAGNLHQEEFLRWMVNNVGDQNSKVSVEKAFSGLGQGKGFVLGSTLTKVLDKDTADWLKPRLTPVEGTPDAFKWAGLLDSAFR